MPMLILSVFLIGALLGMRFKVLILIPAVGIALIATLWIGVVHGYGAGTMLLSAALAWADLQFGYLCGSTGRYSILRARRPHKVLLQANEHTQAS